MMDLINGLLRYARLGREGLEAEPTEVAKVMQQVVQSLAPRIRECGVTIRNSESLCFWTCASRKNRGLKSSMH